MRYDEWLKNKQRYDLKENYYIEKANVKEFSVYFATYEVFPMNIWFRQGFDVFCSILEGNDSCFWIKNDNGTIGGVLLEPNYMNCLFLIPPHEEYDKVLSYLKDILIVWSDSSRKIVVGVVKPHLLRYYLRLGFREGESRRCMIRPTETFNVDWDNEYKIVLPAKESLNDIAHLFHESFDGGADNQGKMSAEEHRSEINKYFEEYYDSEILRNASTLIYDKKSNQLVGACLISLWEGWANIYDVAVHPDSRGKSLATNMIKTALNVLKEHYPVLRLFVTLGNGAEMVYHKLGFLAGTETTEMYLPENIK